jgi:hypothetical protein
MLLVVGRFRATTVRAAKVGVALGATLLAAHGKARAGDASAVSELDPGDAAVKPPVPHRPFVQYGVAFTVEDVLLAGPICSDPNSPCILGSGGGILGRAGWRPSERFYIGGTYELSKQEPNKLYLLGILQQVRAELRNYFPTGNRVTPFVLAGAGVAGYGDEWAIDTWGPSATLGAGIEVQLSGGSLFDLSLLYRPIYLRSFTDSSTLRHDSGIAQFLGLELAVEAQDAL